MIRKKKRYTLFPYTTLFRSCEALSGKGEMAEALQNLQKATQLRPGFAPYLYDQALALVRLNRFDEALTPSNFLWRPRKRFSIRLTSVSNWAQLRANCPFAFRGRKWPASFACDAPQRHPTQIWRALPQAFHDRPPIGELRMIDRSRRNFLKTSTVAAGLSLIRSLAQTEVLCADAPSYASARLTPFPLGSVRLAPGIFKEQAETNARYLDSLSVDRLLHSFRVTAGISSSATPYKGWEDPACELRGHFAGGHFLSAVALASATSGNEVLKRKGDELVSGLAQCQRKIGN